MKINQLINILQKLAAEHGNEPIYIAGDPQALMVIEYVHLVPEIGGYVIFNSDEKS